MGKISVAGAAVAGLGVIGRHPLAVVVWGVALLVLTLLPTVALMAAMGPQMSQMLQTLATQQTGELDPATLQQIMGLQSGMMLFNLGSWLWGTLVNAVVCAAVFRAVLKPAQPGLAYLRLGAQELWLALLFLVESVLFYIVAVIASLIIVALAFIVGMASGQGEMAAGTGVLTAVIAGLVVAGVLIWVSLRLSMAAPMTFADAQFRLFESWTLTRGKGWSLLGVLVLTVILVIVIELLVAGVVLGGLFAAGGPPAWLQDPAKVQAFFAQPPADLLRQVGPWAAIASLGWMLVASVLFTVFCAPWAAAYKALTREA
jgi:hypothetical protein